MSNIARVRVELNPKDEDREIAFRRMFHAWKDACTQYGVMHSYKQHENFESKSRKKRRKSREAEINRIKTNLKENFLQQGRK
jgi:ribosomal protein S21